MATKAQAFQEFIEGFGVPAYAASAVPEDAPFPRITYRLALGAWGQGETSVQVDLWCRTESEAEPNEIVDLISRALGIGGVILRCADGAMWVKRGEPWCQSVPDEDATVKRRYLNLDIETLTTY